MDVSQGGFALIYPLYLYYAAFFGIYKVGEVVRGFDGRDYLISDVSCDGSKCSVHIDDVTDCFLVY